MIRLKDIYAKSVNLSDFILWLISVGLLIDLNGKFCGFCKRGKFYLRKDSSFSSDLHSWRCSNKQCSKKISVRRSSWFHHSNLTLEKCLLITYFWVYQVSEQFVKHELDIANQTIVDYYNFNREVCTVILEKNSEKIGGVGKTVEIDESKFGKRKFHKGRRVEGVWVFGGIERETKRCFFKCVEDRTKDTLLSIIKENICPGTTIISDCWKSYDCLQSEGYLHQKVNHSEHFVDPKTGACTNTIESTWRALKKSLPVSGTVKSLYDSYFAQYCVRKQYLSEASDKFVAFLDLIKQCFDIKTPVSELTTETPLKQEQTEEIPRKRKPLAPISMNNSLDDFDL